MERISKTAKFVDKAAVTLFWISLFSLVMFFALVFPMTFEGGNLKTQAFTVEGFFDVNRFVMVFIIPVKMLMLIVSIFIFRKILKPMKSALPFDETVRKNLAALGWVFAGGGLLINIIRNATLAIIDEHGLDFVMRYEWIDGYICSYEFDMTYFFMAAVLFLVSLVFRYGAELQKQADETL
ncbi:MAG: hypothetical protein IJ306_10285 [Oscillospiraceae bacterium]|nr:hypothetical protein [Oscillospiraceae bacterium]